MVEICCHRGQGDGDYRSSSSPATMFLRKVQPQGGVVSLIDGADDVDLAHVPAGSDSHDESSAGRSRVCRFSYQIFSLDQPPRRGNLPTHESCLTERASPVEAESPSCRRLSVLTLRMVPFSSQLYILWDRHTAFTSLFENQDT
jgi:hypothetical protein